MPDLGFLVGCGSVVANQWLLQDAPGIVGKRRTVTVDFRVHPDLDELWLLPIIHNLNSPKTFTPCGYLEATIRIDASPAIVEVSDLARLRWHSRGQFIGD
jgi:hypothetical protein